MKEEFARELTPERVGQKMNELVALERNPFLRAVPLALKTLVLRLALKLGENGVTAIFSELTVCSYQDDLVFSFTTWLLGHNVQRNFFRLLGELGVPVTILEGQFPEETSSAGQGSRLFRSFTFGCLAVLVAVLAGGQLVWPEAHWGLYAAGGVASLWVMGAFGFYKRRNPLRENMIYSIPSAMLALIPLPLREPSSKLWEMTAQCCLYHHERWDGDGYPFGFFKESIPLPARIIGIADAYDAMTADRPYRKGISEAAALAEIQKGAGTQFDPVLAELFIEAMSKKANAVNW